MTSPIITVAEARERLGLPYICTARRERDILLVALKNLLDDTQHSEHHDCGEGPCPVREARRVVKEIGGA